MELKKEMFFNADNELDTQKTANMIVQNPNHGAKILEFIGDVMRDELEYEYEKKRIKQKYHHDLRELNEKYGYDLDDNE